MNMDNNLTSLITMVDGVCGDMNMTNNGGYNGSYYGNDGNYFDNETNGMDREVTPYYLRPETYIVPLLFAIIFIIGILGNGTLISIFLKHKGMRNVPNMYIISLAVGDLLVILLIVPFAATLYTLESWPFGEFVCKFSEFIKDMSIGVSVFTLTALSADRYFAIANPMRKLQGRKATRITCVTIAGIWLISIGLAMPSAVFSYVRTWDQDCNRIFRVCYPFPPYLPPSYPKVSVMLHFLVYYAIPLLCIGSFYIVMARHLVLSTQNLPGQGQAQVVKQMQGRRKVAKMILSFVVIFAICFFPSHLFLLWFYFYPESENGFNGFWHALRITGYCLSFINSCINPITLYCVSGTFRKKYNEHLFCCCCPKSSSSTGTTVDRGQRDTMARACGGYSLTGGQEKVRITAPATTIGKPQQSLTMKVITRKNSNQQNIIQVNNLKNMKNCNNANKNIALNSGGGGGVIVSPIPLDHTNPLLSSNIETDTLIQTHKQTSPFKYIDESSSSQYCNSNHSDGNK